MRDVRTLDLSNYKTAKKGKRFVCILIDYFLVVIFSFLIFTIANPIFENMGYVKTLKTSYEKNQNETVEILKDTYLQKYDESNVSFVKVDTSATEYVSSLIKTSFYKNNKTYYEKNEDKKEEVKIEEKDICSYLDNGVYVNDRISQYYLNFRTNNKNSFNKTIDSLSRSDFNKNILKLDSTNKDLVDENFDLNDVFYLSSSNADILSDYVNFNDNAGQNLYIRIKNIYIDAINDGISEVENYYQPYLDSLTNFKKNLYAYSRGFDLTCIICYVIGFLICYLVFPLCFKRGRTLSYKVNSLFPLRNDNFDLNFGNYLIKDLILFLDEFSAIFFLPLFIGKLNVLSMPFIFNLTLFQFIIFSFLFSILSLIFFFISKDNQTIPEFASNTYTVDVTTANEEKKVMKDMNSL